MATDVLLANVMKYLRKWMVCRCFHKYFDTVVKPKNTELTESEKEEFHNKALCKSFLEEH